ncbi:DUF421 domain-containing protein [Salirhabdus salicampi]|uniref:DUF421 domain-containing protein n=1 Tax=Salirhabdus salicampi TaxID=476102 RepID=UPI0020C3856F|nr:DUF421 domain-containing protein [Salirhabdus salicampi]MCP8617308.1 DUF421 domain-containing protein [Salirhabdus salicampi]
MIETLKETSIVIGRIITILPLLLWVTLFMGKRAIGELPVFDFLIIVILGAVVGADIADPNIKHFQTAVAIVAIGLLQRFVANLKVSKRLLGRYITFEPTVIIYNGRLLQRNLKDIRYSIDNVLQMLREKEIFDLKDVKMAVIEANGSLSVLKKPEKQTVTNEDMGISKLSTIAYPVVIEGRVYEKTLQRFDVDEQWLQSQFKTKGIEDVNDVFFASINAQHDLHIILMEEDESNVPPLYH